MKYVLMILAANLVFFGILALTIGELRNDNKKLSAQVISLQKEFLSFGEDISNQHLTIVEELDILVHNGDTRTKQISLLEESINPEDKRWAKIKIVREIVQKLAVRKMSIKDYTTIAGAIVDSSEQNDVSISLILAVMRRESAFNLRAKSHAGALGLMQLMPSTASDVAAELGKRRYHLYNAKDNIQMGSFYLNKMLQLFDNDVELAIRGYNAGPTFVRKVNSGEFVSKFTCKNKDGTITKENYYCETAEYHKYVMKYKEEFDKLGL